MRRSEGIWYETPVLIHQFLLLISHFSLPIFLSVSLLTVIYCIKIKKQEDGSEKPGSEIYPPAFRDRVSRILPFKQRDPVNI